MLIKLFGFFLFCLFLGVSVSCGDDFLGGLALHNKLDFLGINGFALGKHAHHNVQLVAVFLKKFFSRYISLVQFSSNDFIDFGSRFLRIVYGMLIISADKHFLRGIVAHRS